MGGFGGEDVFGDEVLNVAEGGVGGAVVDFCPFAGLEFAVETAPKHIDDFDLAAVEYGAAVPAPKQCLLQGAVGNCYRFVYGLSKTIDKPQ